MENIITEQSKTLMWIDLTDTKSIQMYKKILNHKG